MQKIIAKCKPGDVIVVGKKLFVREKEQLEHSSISFQPVRGGAVTFFDADKVVEVKTANDKTFPTLKQIAAVEKLVEFMLDQAEWSDEEMDALRAAFYKSEKAYARKVAEYDESLPGGMQGSYKHAHTQPKDTTLAEARVLRERLIALAKKVNKIKIAGAGRELDYAIAHVKQAVIDLVEYNK